MWLWAPAPHCQPALRAVLPPLPKAAPLTPCAGSNRPLRRRQQGQLSRWVTSRRGQLIPAEPQGQTGVSSQWPLQTGRVQGHPPCPPHHLYHLPLHPEPLGPCFTTTCPHPSVPSISPRSWSLQPLTQVLLPCQGSLAPTTSSKLDLVSRCPAAGWCPVLPLSLGLQGSLTWLGMVGGGGQK